MSDRELDAAGIRDPHLRESYERCRHLNAKHGKTYYLATLLLSALHAAEQCQGLTHPGRIQTQLHALDPNGERIERIMNSR